MAEQKKHAGGRPLKYKTKAELQKGIDGYFAECKAKDEPLTITGLALELDIDTQTLINYSNLDEFFATVKRAKQKIEHQYELRLIKNGRAGDIFALKNFKWQDKTEVEQEIKGDFKVEIEIIK